jgi:endo-alpha-1,4-polygalactosaminidase (GH114 family)
MKKHYLLIILIVSVILLTVGCSTDSIGNTTENSTSKHSYGVFLSIENDLDRLDDYETVVIDAQYFSKEEIEAFRSKGHTVISYINIGSLENFRPYYDDYKDLKLGDYENWEEEIWINVADPKWQEFITEQMIPELTGKGIDGFFVDNCDVYYHFPALDVQNGLTFMMRSMISTGKKVIINGGDCYLDAYCENGGSWNDVITGINQETVFSKIIWNTNRFGTADPEDNEYFKDYIERYASMGADIYLLEYTQDKNLINKIDDYCKSNGFVYYVSDSIELD